MRSLRSALVVTGTIAAPAVLAPWVSADPTLQPFHLTTECSDFAGRIPSFCTVTSANVAAISARAKVFYLGPVLGDAGNNFGMCAFREGTGRLTGFYPSANGPLGVGSARCSRSL
jgi:hypothetical protein